MTETVSLEFLARQSKANVEEMRQVRKELAQMMTIVSGSFDYIKRIDRNQHELSQDLALTVKIELGGAIANLQTTLEGSLNRIEENIANVSERLATVEGMKP